MLMGLTGSATVKAGAVGTGLAGCLPSAYPPRRKKVLVILLLPHNRPTATPWAIT
jgi:hypothetical protein